MGDLADLLRQQDQSGVVYWFTGLSGAGKTTIGKVFYQKLRQCKKNVVFLDGDILREVFGGGHGHSLEERKELAMHYARLCHMLSSQGIDVVMATISMFHEVRRWNRENIVRYQEIYLKVPLEVLIERNQKGLYSRAMRGEVENIMGVDVEIEEPECPEYMVVNDGCRSPDEIALFLWGSMFSTDR